LKPVHDIDADEIAEDRNDIWDNTPFFSSKIDRFPSLIFSIKMNKKGRE
jgi:hypothetical protein